MTFKLFSFLRILIWLSLVTGSIYGFRQLLRTYYESFLSLYEVIPNMAYTNIPIHSDSKYDFIIVGSGSAGAVIANRLSEISNWTILLLEAGEKASFFTDIPFTAPAYQVLGGYNWGYVTEKEDNACLAMMDQRCNWPKGKALGGSTVINYMIYSRGHPKDFDDWGKENPGWSWNEVLPYFLKSEDCQMKQECKSNWHNEGGYLGVEEPYQTRLTDYFIAAGKNLGYKHIDYNTGNMVGFSKIQANLKFGRRHSTASAFLDPVSGRANLKIVSNAHVTKILIDSESKAAYGVEFMRRNKKISVNASKEVILSAGVINSPQLLMLSGIGPKEHLEELGIFPIIQDLPVGRNLHDHLAFAGLLYTIDKEIIPKSSLLNPITIFRWLFKGEGLWTTLGGIEGIGYISTTNQSQPDLEFLVSAVGSMQYDRGLISIPELRIPRSFYDNYFKPIENTPVFMFNTILLHPKSVGSLKLRSKDPYDPPLCYGNYLSDTSQEDIARYIKGVRLIQKIAQYEEFQKLNATLYSKPVPGCENFVFDSDSYWECVIRHISISIHHQIGTCKMGSDSSSVVDSRLRVHGVKNLRVADSSVMPSTISGHTSAATTMIGEKAADIVKEDYGIKMSS